MDGALSGIYMFADPSAHIGKSYYQEYYQVEAEDMAEILSINENVTVPYNSFDTVVQTYDYSPLEPDLKEHKYYAQGTGLIKTIDLNTGEEEALIDYLPPSK